MSSDPVFGAQEPNPHGEPEPVSSAPEPEPLTQPPATTTGGTGGPGGAEPPLTTEPEPGLIETIPDGDGNKVSVSTSLTTDELSVLSMYADLEDRDMSMTVGTVAKKLNLTQAALRAAVTVLKGRLLLTGTRKFTSTPQGRVVLAGYGEAPPVDEPAAPAQGENEPLPEAPQAPSGASQAPIMPTGQVSAMPVVTSPLRPPMVAEKRTLSEVVAERLMITPKQAWAVVKNQVISLRENEPPASDAEILHVLSVMQKYELDPFVKQVYAFRHQGKLNVAVGIDGWIDLAQRNPKFLGVTYKFPEVEAMPEMPDGKMAWPWVKATCHVNGRHPTVAYAFLDEWFVKGTGNRKSNWEEKPNYRLKMKAHNLSVREGLGISLYDDADHEQIVQAQYKDITRPGTAALATAASMTKQLVVEKPDNAVAGTELTEPED